MGTSAVLDDDVDDTFTTPTLHLAGRAAVVMAIPIDCAATVLPR